MQKVKQLNTLIDQACSDAHNQPPVKLYYEILSLIESRVDMPKHSIFAISKKLTTKNKKILFICFDLLEYLSYNLELPFFSQIATKQFLFKISGLMMAKQVDPMIMDKILKLVKCLDQIFRPLDDLLPLFFQFQAGLLRKQFDIPYDYVSPYRPKQLKQYKKPQLKEEKKKKIVEPTKDQQKKFEQIRQKIILTNDIINNSDPSADVRKNQILMEMMEHLKECQKTLSATINENPTESLVQLALAANDDLVVTYRRYKDLQRNRKPQIFSVTELASDIQKMKQIAETKPIHTSRPQQKVQSKTQIPKNSSVFQDFNDSPSKKIQTSSKQSAPIKKQEPINIFDMIEGPEQKHTEVTQISNDFNLMDISRPQDTTNNSQINSLDLLGNLNVGEQNQTNSGGASSMNLGSMFTMDFSTGKISNGVTSPIYLQQPIYQQPIYQQSVNQQPVYTQPVYGQAIYDQGINSGSLYPQANYRNVTLETNQQKKVEQNIDAQKQITQMDDFKQFFQSKS